MIPIHFYDLDSTLWDTHSKEVIIDKRKPGATLLRLSAVQSFQSKHLNRNYELEINYNGETRFLDPTIWEKLLSISKGITLNDIGISQREFTQEESIKKQEDQVSIFLYAVRKLKGTDATIGIITARSKQKEHTDLIKKLKETIKSKVGIEVSKIYFVNDKSTSDPDATSFKKAKILIEHLIGLKIKGNCFSDLQQTASDEVNFYDNDEKNIDAAININYLFLKLFHASPDNLKKDIITRMKASDLKLIVNKITNNKLNPYITTEVTLKYPYSGEKDETK